ncbi:hypothetical protein F5J12DRAFT_850720 [Pisolithus orientalis]|uniref:uncharacterized protein n=1 Tax=Pisolithus orientalis TaxID=936130 RepID=UPI00222531FE|nr:uncharacterized protein F5J12DRAFT_850720 [Pisolithus orientalis]KAI5997851.1 hypothetical protein F5J12DRAFT_850720 [Pisolithus orientalis]
MGRERTEQASQAPDRERRIQAAISGVANGLYKSYRTAAKAEGVVRQTLMIQVNGHCKTRDKAFTKLQLLTPIQEETLVDWCRLNSSSATPLHFTNLRAQALQVCGKHPGKNWPRRFLIYSA